MLLHPLTNFEIQKDYQNESRFNDDYSRNNLSKIKDGAYIINFDEYESIGTHWIALYVNAKNVTYFDSFGIKYIQTEIKKFSRYKNIITNFYRIEAYDSIMCRYFGIGYFNFILKSESLLEYTNLFSPNEYKKHDNVFNKYRKF